MPENPTPGGDESVRRLLRLFAQLDDVAFLKLDAVQFGAPLVLASQKKLEIQTEVLELFLLDVGHDRLRQRVLFGDIPWSYQLIASASSISEAIMRANVRSMGWRRDDAPGRRQGPETAGS